MDSLFKAMETRGYQIEQKDGVRFDVNGEKIRFYVNEKVKRRERVLTTAEKEHYWGFDKWIFTPTDIGGAEGSLNPGRAIAIDESGNAYITGSTSSANFPLANAAQSVIGRQNDAFVSKLSANGTALIYSTYLGGSGDDLGKSIGVNVGGGASITGIAGPNFPIVNNPNPGIGFVAKFSPSGYLRRNPNDAPDLDFSGYNFWLNKLNLFNGNFVNAEMVKAFINSGEYRHRSGP